MAKSFNSGCCGVCVNCIEDVIKSYLRWQRQDSFAKTFIDHRVDEHTEDILVANYIHDLQEAQK